MAYDDTRFSYCVTLTLRIRKRGSVEGAKLTLRPVTAASWWCKYSLWGTGFMWTVWFKGEPVTGGQHASVIVGIYVILTRRPCHSHQHSTMSDDTILPIPNLSLSQHVFTLLSPSLRHLHDNARTQLLDGIKADSTSISCTDLNLFR